MIVSLEICERNERILIISASIDGSVQLYDFMGNHFGVFGQVKIYIINHKIQKSNICAVGKLINLEIKRYLYSLFLKPEAVNKSMLLIDYGQQRFVKCYSDCYFIIFLGRTLENRALHSPWWEWDRKWRGKCK